MQLLDKGSRLTQKTKPRKKFEWNLNLLEFVILIYFT